MPKKNHRQGGKFKGSHTSVWSDFAGEVADFLARQPEVSRVTPGLVKKGGGRQRVVIVQKLGVLVVKVISGGSSQEFIVATSNFARTREAIEKEFK